MYNKYEELNDDARDYFLVWLANKIKDDDVLTRCKKEVDLIYDKVLLFFIEFLHKYKETEKSVSFHFRGMANNLLLLHVIGISKVDPVKYNLPYELFADKILCIDFINGFTDKHLFVIRKNVGYVRRGYDGYDQYFNLEIDPDSYNCFVEYEAASFDWGNW